MLVSLTVGKVDAGVAVLLTKDNRLIEFPSVLLPDNITSGSIVDITVSRNRSAEAASVAQFQALQKRILHTYGINTPSPPVLRLRNATQTSLVLEWDPINLATASLKSLSLYRNGSKAGSIPRPLETLSTKISGLAIDTEYTFHLVLRTTAGTYSSQRLVCRTHKMTDLSGITITPGVLPANLKEYLAETVKRIGAKMIDTVRIDTTHFVCTEGRGPAWEKAVEMNIPVVRPEWVEACEREGTIVSVRGYYLNADPKSRQIGPGVGANQNRNSTFNSPTSSSSIQRQKVPPNINASTEGKEVPAPPVTPFPGADTLNGTTSHTEEEESESPPPPPPKDNETEARNSREKEEEEPSPREQPETQEDEPGECTPEDEKDEQQQTVPEQLQSPAAKPGELQSSPSKSERASPADQSLPQFRQEGPETNGSNADTMEEVPL
ncbi:hypothetical protein VTO42DRAFT_6497 [Malbranchea cinnamomea]